MGLMTLAEFRTELRFIFKNRNDEVVDSARLNRVLNQTYSHVCQPEVRKHKELLERQDITLVSGQVDYDLATLISNNVLAIEDLIYYNTDTITSTATKSEVEPRSLNWMNKRTVPGEGRTTLYALDGERLVIYPAPGGVEAGNQLRLWYWTEPTVLAADDNKTVLGTYWDRVILRGAQWMLEYDAGFRELALLTEQEYVKLINEKADDYELSEVDGSRADFKTERYF